jgi:hypothetical protein
MTTFNRVEAHDSSFSVFQLHFVNHTKHYPKRFPLLMALV